MLGQICMGSYRQNLTPGRPNCFWKMVIVQKPATKRQVTSNNTHARIAPTVHRLKPAAQVWQPKIPAVHVRQTAQLRKAPGIIQATKFFPNLHPGAVESIDPNNVFRLNSFANQYRLHKPSSHGVNVPNQQYNFVRTREGEMLLHNRYRHPSIAQGKHVLYAGEIFFNNGQLQWWSNGSGHYQPNADDAVQANLPMDHFYSYQQIIKGEHKWKKR